MARFRGAWGAWVVLAGCSGDAIVPLEPPDTDTTTGVATDTTTDSTAGPTTSPESFSGSGQLPGDDGSGSSEGSSDDGCECRPDEQCIAGLCFSCPPPVCERACGPEACECPPDDPCCGIGTCVPPDCDEAPLPGNYAGCVDAMGNASDAPCAGATCVVDSAEAPTGGVCMASGCQVPCQCPPAPATGDAEVTCEEITGDALDDCWLDCGSGETCPDGMICFAGFVCLFEVGEGIDVPLYGDCVSAPGLDCADGGACLTAPDGGVCTMACGSAAECEPGPATGDAEVSCSDLTNDALDECWLSCQGGETCPDGMQCFGGIVCIWPEMPPPPPPGLFGYGDCADNPVSTCQPGEDVCLADAGGTAAACSHGGCAVAADCPAAPPTGSAPVACADLGLGNTCYLDCAGGQSCPSGTTCTAVGGGMACLWPDDGYVLDEDFERGAFRPGWSLIDVDGHMPDPSVSFVTDAWVVTDELGPGANLGAYSTSWYVPAAQADDWLITPQLVLGPASVLSWSAWAPDAAFADGYEVRISTGLPTVGDFFANPSLFTIANEADVFTPHMVDLAAAGYGGQAVYIAFRNDSNDDFLLVVDDVRVTE